MKRRNGLITRAMKQTTVTAKVYNKATKKTAEHVITFPRYIADGHLLDKAINRYFEKQNKVVLEVVKVERTSQVMGMDIETFLAHAKPLEDKAKPIKKGR